MRASPLQFPRWLRRGASRDVTKFPLKTGAKRVSFSALPFRWRSALAPDPLDRRQESEGLCDVTIRFEILGI